MLNYWNKLNENAFATQRALEGLAIMEERIYILKIKDDLGKRKTPYLFLYKDEHIYRLNYRIDPIKVINGNVEKAIKSTKEYDIYSDNKILNYSLKVESTNQEVGVYHPRIHRPIYENDGSTIFR